ncbi:MAG: hypothetical protein ACI836_001215, partial [Saprospiraceae bacterium]
MFALKFRPVIFPLVFKVLVFHYAFYGTMTALSAVSFLLKW